LCIFSGPHSSLHQTQNWLDDQKYAGSGLTRFELLTMSSGMRRPRASKWRAEEARESLEISMTDKCDSNRVLVIGEI